MNRANLMQEFLQCPAMFRSVILTDTQVKVLSEISKLGMHGITASQFAASKGISVQSASGRLNALCLKLYLDRREVIQGSGGIEFIYFETVKQKLKQEEK